MFYTLYISYPWLICFAAQSLHLSVFFTYFYPHPIPSSLATICLCSVSITVSVQQPMTFSYCCSRPISLLWIYFEWLFYPCQILEYCIIVGKCWPLHHSSLSHMNTFCCTILENQSLYHHEFIRKVLKNWEAINRFFRRCFTLWATREALQNSNFSINNFCWKTQCCLRQQISSDVYLEVTGSLSSFWEKKCLPNIRSE